MAIGEERYLEDRRQTERQFNEVWATLQKLGDQLTGLASTMSRHAVTCEKDAEVRTADRGKMMTDIHGMKTAVDALTETAKQRKWTRRLVRTVFTVAASVVGTLGTTVAGLWALWEHLGPWILRLMRDA